MPPWCAERMEGPSKIEEVPRFARLVNSTWSCFVAGDFDMNIFLHAANSWFFDASGSSWKRFFHTVDPLMGFTITSREGFNKIPMGHSLELVGKWEKRPAALVAWGSKTRTWSKQGQVILVVLSFFFWMPRITNWNEGAGHKMFVCFSLANVPDPRFKLDPGKIPNLAPNATQR